jgi:uracil-DNA glycosylase family 4
VSLNQRIVACTRCPRLIEHCAEVARTKRRAYRDETYWGKPVPSFGVAQPRLLVVGLAPGAHGANRTGRMFTGDSSGDWLYRALHEHGFANQAGSTHRRDGLKLLDARITAAAHCAPPGNKPSRTELDACRPFLVEEIGGLRRLRVVLALGGIAFDAVRKAWRELERPPFAPKPKFAHRAEAVSGDVTLLCSYHPSRQNTQTGRLTRAMWHGVFRRARRLLDA